MECDICRRDHDAKRLPFLCAVDARNQLYEGRIKNLRFLIENEDLQKQIEETGVGAASPTQDRRDMLQSQQRLAEDRTTQIIAAADKLRSDIKAAREEIEARKAALSRRKSDFAAVSSGLAERRTKQLKDVEKSAQATRYRWAQSAERMSGTRAFLCFAAGNLYGLKRVKQGTPGLYEYSLGGIPVVDLNNMNSLSPEIISTSLAHISHILVLACHYLVLRLPAAITLPHRDYPRPTIFNLSGSYKTGDLPFPTQSGPATPNVDNPTPDSAQVPRPRPLFIDKPLAQLAKDDPTTFSYFIEGVTLLAYNIAWVCCTQGISIGDKASFEDICNMGRNLYNLLITQTSAGVDQPPESPSAKSPNPNNDPNAQADLMGRFSHGTTFYFLGSADGTEFTKSFKLPGPMKLADRLKKRLLSEAPVPDWEVLDDDAWKVEGAGEPVVDKKDSPRRGSSGWMKVKNR